MMRGTEEQETPSLRSGKQRNKNKELPLPGGGLQFTFGPPPCNWHIIYKIGVTEYIQDF